MWGLVAVGSAATSLAAVGVMVASLAGGAFGGGESGSGWFGGGWFGMHPVWQGLAALGSVASVALVGLAESGWKT